VATVSRSVNRTVEAVTIANRRGRGALVLVCDHASNHIPSGYRGLDLSESDLQRHIAWDIGALGVADRLGGLLDAPLVYGTHSRLLIDLNRDPNAPDSIVAHSEDTPIPGNAELSAAERRHRRDWLYEPYHTAIETLIDERVAAGRATALVAIHSFTPTWLGQPRPWQVGVLYRNDRRLSDQLLGSLRGDSGLCVGANEPYAPDAGVYHTVGRHGEQRGLACAMIELRQDLIAQPEGQSRWAARLAREFTQALEGLHGAGVEGIPMH
jgi:predicted N-formylglutamate amidohydrolase